MQRAFAVALALTTSQTQYLAKLRQEQSCLTSCSKHTRLAVQPVLHSPCTINKVETKQADSYSLCGGRSR